MRAYLRRLLRWIMSEPEDYGLFPPKPEREPQEPPKPSSAQKCRRLAAVLPGEGVKCPTHGLFWSDWEQEIADVTAAGIVPEQE